MTEVVKGINMLFNKKELKGIREYIIKRFVFCYNNNYLVY